MIQTSRLFIRKMSVIDAPFVYKLLNSTGWQAFIGDRGVESVEKAASYIEEKYLPSYQNGLGNFVVTLSSSGIPIGTCGLYQRENLDAPDLGYAFLPDYMGKGFAFEAASALLEYAFQELKLQKVYAFTNPNNSRSQSLLAKLSFEKQGGYVPLDENKSLNLFVKMLQR